MSHKVKSERIKHLKKFENGKKEKREEKERERKKKEKRKNRRKDKIVLKFKVNEKK